MRLLFVNSVSDRAGGASSAFTLAAALADAGVDVSLACSTRGDLARRAAARADIDVHMMRFGPDFDPAAAAALARIARSVRPDIVLADRRKDVKLLALARGFGMRRPVVHRHGAPSVLRDGAVYRFAWRRLAAMVVNSAAMRTAILDATPWLETVDIIRVVHNGVDTERFRPMPDRRGDARARFGLPAHAFVVAFAGTLQARKRVDLLVRSAAELTREARPHLLLIGDGPERAALESLAHHLDVPAAFAGHRTDLPELLAAADAVAHLSAAEGFSNSVLEALACALPVIATDEHSHPEQIDDGVTGLLVRPDPADVAAALQRLRMNPRERALLARAARETAVDRFAMDAMARGYVAVFEEIRARG